MLTFASGGWVLILAGVLVVATAVGILWPVLTGRPRPVGDGANVESYRFDLSNCLMDRDELVPSGVSKDGLHAMMSPRFLTVAGVDVMNNERTNEGGHKRLLVPDERVIGVTLGGQSKAYPVNILMLHEVVNDVVGNVPVVVTFSGVCDSAVVMDRRVEGKTLEFGFSGLLYQSNLLMYDRQPGGAGESLWSQLQWRAVAGPAAGRKTVLTLLPFEFVTYGQWKLEHPDGLVLAPEPSLEDEYKADRYSHYYASDEVKFAVKPLWDDPRYAKKTHMLAEQTEAGWKLRVVERVKEHGPTTIAATEKSMEKNALPGIRIPCLLFAWYAQHPQESAIAATPWVMTYEKVAR